MSHLALHGWYNNQLEEILVFLLWKGNRARLGVNPPPQHLFLAGPITLTCHQIHGADGILGFARQERKNPFQCPYRAVEDLALSVCPPPTPLLSHVPSNNWCA